MARKLRPIRTETTPVEGFPLRRKPIEIKHLNQAQRELSGSIRENSITFAVGPAGTGKTMISTLHAMLAFTEGEVDKIIICRPAVEAGGEKLGFLPGGLNEKMDPWMRPIMDVFQTYWSKRTITDMIADGRIEITPLCYLRGRTFHDSVVILDEGQNTTDELMLMALTRLGDGSKMIITGDLAQKDIRQSGLETAMRRLRDVPDIGFVFFDESHVVRHPTVKQILINWGPIRA